MSRSEDDSSVRLSYSSDSRPASKAHSMGLPARVESITMATLNVLFLGETNLGGCSILDLIAGSGDKNALQPAGHGGHVVRNITLDGKIFTLHAPSTSGSVATATLREGIRGALMNLRKNGGVHLFVYCVDASHSTLWIHKIQRTITSYSPTSPHIPAVAVITGISDVGQQESWWSSNENTWAKGGLRFDAHAFIRVLALGARSPTGDHISESRRILHTLILQNCSHVLNSVTTLHTEYQQQSMANPIQSLLHVIAGKSSSNAPTGSTAIDIILLGGAGVGKSSLINLIARRDVARVSSDTIGCTRTVDLYTFEERGRTFHLYDTPGLVDPEMGVKAFVDPIDTIQKIIHSIGNGKGPDLLLFCIDNSRPTVALQRSYRLFCKIICGDKVPFALAVTKLDEGQDVDQWWSQHKATIREYGIHYTGHIGLGWKKKQDPNADLEGRWRETLLTFFITCTDRQKKGSLHSSMGRTVRSVTAFLRSQVSTPEKILMRQCGVEQQIARELVSRLIATQQSCE